MERVAAVVESEGLHLRSGSDTGRCNETLGKERRSHLNAQPTFTETPVVIVVLVWQLQNLQLRFSSRTAASVSYRSSDHYSVCD